MHYLIHLITFFKLCVHSRLPLKTSRAASNKNRRFGYAEHFLAQVIKIQRYA
jgi:hypothetical protein